MTTVSIFEIPLIRDEIALSLTPADLAHCCRVNSVWNSAFGAVLYRDLNLIHHHQLLGYFFLDSHHTTVSSLTPCQQKKLDKSTSSSSRSPARPIIPSTGSPTVQKLLRQRNKDHVRSIHSIFCYAFLSLPEDMVFRSLQRLETLASEYPNKGILDVTNTQRILTFVEKSAPQLQDLVLVNFPLSCRTTSVQLRSTVERHRSLRSLSLSSFREARLENLQEVMRGVAAEGSKVEKLSIVCRGALMKDDVEDQGQGEREDFWLMRPGSVCRLRELALDANLSGMAHQTLLALLEHCPQLDRLYLPTRLSLPSTSAITSTLTDSAPLPRDSFEGVVGRLVNLLSTPCSGIQHLEVAWVEAATDESQSKLLTACQGRGLSSYTLLPSAPSISTTRSNMSASSTSTSSFMPTSVFLGKQTIQALLDFHWATLERLDIKACTGGIQSLELQRILTSCPNLVVFDALNPNKGRGVVEGGSGEMVLNAMDMIRGKQWICRRLRVLKLGFTIKFGTTTDRSSVSTSSSKTEQREDRRSLIHCIYNNLASLTELRELHLGYTRRPIRLPTSFTTSSTTTRSYDYDEFDLTLSSGLGALSTLTRLSTFNIQHMGAHRLGWDEVEWMVRSWPRLIRFCAPLDLPPPTATGPGPTATVQQVEIANMNLNINNNFYNSQTLATNAQQQQQQQHQPAQQQHSVSHFTTTTVNTGSLSQAGGTGVPPNGEAHHAGSGSHVGRASIGRNSAARNNRRGGYLAELQRCRPELIITLAI